MESRRRKSKRVHEINKWGPSNYQIHFWIFKRKSKLLRYVDKNDKIQKTVYTDLYITDKFTHSYLHYSSSHRSYCIKGDPDWELLRLRIKYHYLIYINEHATARLEDCIRWGCPRKVSEEALLSKTRKAYKESLPKEKSSKASITMWVPWFVVYITLSHLI